MNIHQNIFRESTENQSSLFVSFSRRGREKRGNTPFSIYVLQVELIEGYLSRY